MNDAERNAALVAKLARAGDAISEMLGVSVARSARGETLARDQIESIREDILRWHLIKAEATSQARPG